MKILNILDLGLCPYGKAWDIQKKHHAKRIAGEIHDTLILVEHPHVYTLGKNANAGHLIAGQDYLKRRGIEIYNVDRGGDITYHGPGQLVGYPIFNLKNHKESIGWYVHTVEQVLIELLAMYQITAQRVNKLTGVWVGNRKIAALGMRVSRWVTMHGFALNVSTDLSLYDGIIPCGITSKGVTRILDLNPGITMDQVKRDVAGKFTELFGFDVPQIKNDWHYYVKSR
ncbi:MAG TPA: lipoyl(octanoyl) transferase LipB [Candidatus Marinimicrobia bacterium]|mgnify:CR=1 FL=1|nr:lipoyl(octanoyl) transferase LipB [Candidatus Neomarinimicrobiota bacterium]